MISSNNVSTDIERAKNLEKKLIQNLINSNLKSKLTTQQHSTA